MEMPDMDLEGNIELPGVDMEGQEFPPQVIKIDDTEIPQDPSIIEPETALYVPDEPDGPTKVSTPDTEGPCISTRVR